MLLTAQFWHSVSPVLMVVGFALIVVILNCLPDDEEDRPPF